MITVNIRADFSDIVRKLDRLPLELQSKVIPAALNKVAAKGNTEMVRQITSEFKISAAEVRSRLRIIRAKRSLQEWAALIDPYAGSKRGRALNLIHFLENKVTLAEGRRRKKAGTQSQLRFQIKKVGAQKIITGAFIGNNGRTVFVRVGKDRLPIKALSTIDVPQMFNSKRIVSAVVTRINAELAIEFDRAIKAAIAGIFR